MTEPFGSLLRHHRVARGLTQEELAERASLSTTAIAALERGRNRAPRMSTLRQLARVLELGPDDLATFTTAASTEWAPARPPQGPARFEAHPPTVAAAQPPLAGLGGPPRRTAAVPPSPAVHRRWRSDFVGRGPQLQQLQAAWERRCRLVEVVGEAGIGKTRLVSELTRSVRAEATVLWGRCSQDYLGSYLPFVEMLRHLIANADADALRAAVGGRGELTRLVPELAERTGPLPAATRAEAGTEQRLLFEAVVALLAPWLPMLMVIDDLHWADEPTLAMLRYLALDHRLDGLVVAVTARPSDLDPAASGRLAELGREVEVARVSLAGLDGAELASLVTDLVGATVTPTLVRSVAAATDGNPFFAEEMTLHLVDAGLVARTGESAELRGDLEQAGVPERVRDTVVRRLLALSADGMALLSAGSIIGREFELSVAGAASGVAGAHLVDAADDALLSGMVLEIGPGRFAFSHALVRDAVGSRLSYARRASIHRQVAEHIEARWPDDPGTAAELARHWAAVANVDPTAVVAAATWAVRAGDVALAAAAAEDAIARYEEASALWATASAGHVDALIRLGVALRYRGRADEADARFREATDLAVALREPRLQARAAIGFGQRYPYWDIDAERIAVLEASLAALPPGEEVLEVVLKGLLVTHLVNGFEPAEASRRDGLADELAAIAADPATSTEVLRAVGQTRIYDCIEDPATLRGVADRLLAAAAADSDLRVEAGARFAHALAALDDGDLAALQAASDRYDRVVTRLEDPRERSQAVMVRSTIACIEGRYDNAATLSDEALVLGRASGDFNAELLHYAQDLLRAIDQGLAEDVLPLLLASDEYMQIGSFDAGTALCAALAGEADLARQRVRRLVSTGFQGSPRGADWLAPTAFLAHACAVTGHVDDAAALYERLSSAPATVVRVGPLTGWWGPVDHHLGCLARLLGRESDAERHLRRALEIDIRMHGAAFTARTRAELACVVSSRHPDEAARLGAEARAGAAAIGAVGVGREVERSLAGLGF